MSRLPLRLPHRTTLALAAALLALAPLSTPAQVSDPQLHTASPTELGCIKVLLAQERAWNQGNLEAFAKSYKDAPSILFLSSASISRGFAGMLDTYRHNYPTRAAMGTLAFSNLEVLPLDERFAVVTGHFKLDRSKKEGGNSEGNFSLVMEKTPDGWKIIVDHTT